MAIKKSEVIATLTDRQRAQIDMYEQCIDDALRERYSGENGIEVEIAGYLDKKVLNELKKRYAAAGWTITYKCDQREGCFFLLV